MSIDACRDPSKFDRRKVYWWRLGSGPCAHTDHLTFRERLEALIRPEPTLSSFLTIFVAHALHRSNLNAQLSSFMNGFSSDGEGISSTRNFPLTESSRRFLLKNTILIGADTVATTMFTGVHRAEAKVPKTLVQYRDKPDSSHRYDNCATLSNQATENWLGVTSVRVAGVASGEKILQVK